MTPVPHSVRMSSDAFRPAHYPDNDSDSASRADPVRRSCCFCPAASQSTRNPHPAFPADDAAHQSMHPKTPDWRYQSLPAPRAWRRHPCALPSPDKHPRSPARRPPDARSMLSSSRAHAARKGNAPGPGTAPYSTYSRSSRCHTSHLHARCASPYR